MKTIKTIFDFIYGDVFSFYLLEKRNDFDDEGRVRQFFNWLVWFPRLIFYRLTFVWKRAFGKCDEQGCDARPVWVYDPDDQGLACDKHVSRGCCSVSPEEICCEWRPLPFTKNQITWGRQATPEEQAAHDKEEEEMLSTLCHQYNREGTEYLTWTETKQGEIK